MACEGAFLYSMPFIVVLEYSYRFDGFIYILNDFVGTAKPVIVVAGLFLVS